MSDTRSRALLHNALQSLTRLQYIEYKCPEKNQGQTDVHNTFLNSLVCKPKAIYLSGVVLDDNSFIHISFAKSIERLYLRRVFMTSTGWNNFIERIGKVRGECDIPLIYTNIDESSISLIASNLNFTIVCKDGTRNNNTSSFIRFYTHPPQKLTFLGLANITLHDSALLITPAMTSLRNIRLSGIDMTAWGWNALIVDVNSIQNRIRVILEDTNIDAESVSHIVNSSVFTVISNSQRSKDERYEYLRFYTKPPCETKELSLKNCVFGDGGRMSFDDVTRLISPVKTSLRKISFTSMNMPASDWKALIVGLYSIQNNILVGLQDTNIDADSVSHIVESSAFTVISNSQRSEDGRYQCLYFYTKPPYKIEHISLCECALGDSGLTISDDMTRLEEISLTSVKMSRKGWYKFIDCIRSVENIRLCIALDNTNIDKESIDQVTSCSNVEKVSGRDKDNESTILLFVGYLCAPKFARGLCTFRDRRDVWALVYLMVLIIVSIMVGIIADAVSDPGTLDVTSSAKAIGYICFEACGVVGGIVGFVYCGWKGCLVLLLLGLVVGTVVGLVAGAVVAAVGSPFVPVAVSFCNIVARLLLFLLLMYYLVKRLCSTFCAKRCF